MKIILALILFVCISAKTQACTCIGSANAEIEFKAKDLVIEGKVLSKNEVVIWSDTTSAMAIYKSNKAKNIVPYFEYKMEHYGERMLDFKVVVTQNYKGSMKSDTLTVRTGLRGGSCGFNFEIGENYLICAQEEAKIEYTLEKLGRSKKELKGIYRTNICSRTKKQVNAGEDLEYLRKR